MTRATRRIAPSAPAVAKPGVEREAQTPPSSGPFFQPPRWWPNGSGFSAAPENGVPGEELGRVYREGDAWRVLRWTEHGYLDMGTAEGELQGMAMLPHPERKPLRTMAGDASAKPAVATRAGKPSKK